VQQVIRGLAFVLENPAWDPSLFDFLGKEAINPPGVAIIV
jgi:hypothetical protein